MASSDSKDDSFRVRVDRVFGSLASARNPKLQSSLWSISDDKVEKREWRRSTDSSGRDEMPCSASFDECLRSDRKVLRKSLRKTIDDDEVEEVEEDDDDDDKAKQSYREIRSTIGLDSTLDREEEEDEYDKVATGRENAGERLYMGEVTNHGRYLNSHNVLPTSVCDSTKDPRANHLAARMRLKEDDSEAQKFVSHLSSDLEVTGVGAKTSTEDQPKPILKRKDTARESKSQKRVRFDPNCINNREELPEHIQDSFGSDSPMSIAADINGGSIISRGNSKVPDYILNPSKYTCYSLDSSSEVDDESNKRACLDFLRLVQGSKSGEQEDAPVDLPKSVTFIPKKKSSDSTLVAGTSEVKQKLEEDTKQSLNGSGGPVGIAAREAQHEIINMDEDLPETGTNNSFSSQKPSRRYRTKSNSEDSDS